MIGMRSFLSAWVLAVAMAGFAAAAEAAGALDRVFERGKIVVAVNDDYAPQSFRDGDGRWQGFDVAVAGEIAKRLKVGIEFVTPPWELVVSGRWRGRWEIAVNSMAATKPRAKNLDFAVAYYFAPVRAAVFEDDGRLQSVEDLHGKVIGVCTGCSYESYVLGRLDIVPSFDPQPALALRQVEARAFADEWAAAEALGPAAGSGIDAVIASEPTLTAMLKDDYPIRLLDGRVFNEPLAIAAEKGEFAMVARLKEILREMRADGTLKRLSMEWFGTDYSQPAPLK